MTSGSSTSSTSRAPRGRRSLALASALAALSLSAGDARAQRTAADIESARQAYNEGIALRDRGDLRGAVDKFRAAHALGNTPITGLELCRTYAVLGQPVEARETCLGVARIAPGASETARSDEARREAARLAEDVKSKISGIKIALLGVPAGREPTVTVDGVPVPPVALAQPRAVNPGSHVIVAKVGAGGETRATLETREGETRSIELVVQPPPDDGPVAAGAGAGAPTGGPDAPRPEAKKSSALATVGWVIAGVGGAVTLATGAVALAKSNSLEEDCPGDKCGAPYHDDLDAARAWGNVATGAFVVAGVGAVLGLIGTASAGSRTTGATAPVPSARGGPKVTPMLGLGGAGLHGTF